MSLAISIFQQNLIQYKNNQVKSHLIRDNKMNKTDFNVVTQCIKWQNIEYNFNDNNSSKNCSLNVFIGREVSMLTYKII